MKAKLPSWQADSGFTTKFIESVLDHGEVSLWSLVDDENETSPQCYVVINGVLVSIGPLGPVKQAISQGRMPDRQDALLSLLQQKMRQGNEPLNTHRLVWEALESDRRHGLDHGAAGAGT